VSICGIVERVIRGEYISIVCGYITIKSVDAMSERKERTRALFKKGQKCLIPAFVYDGERGEDIIIFEPAQVRDS